MWSGVSTAVMTGGQNILWSSVEVSPLSFSWVKLPAVSPVPWPECGGRKDIPSSGDAFWSLWVSEAKQESQNRTWPFENRCQNRISRPDIQIFKFSNLNSCLKGCIFHRSKPAPECYAHAFRWEVSLSFWNTLEARCWDADWLMWSKVSLGVSSVRFCMPMGWLE